MTPWYLYGAGGLGVETLDILHAAMAAGLVSDHEPVFIVDNSEADTVVGVPVVPLDQAQPGAPVTIAVGEPDAREVLKKRAQDHGLVLSSVVSPLAFVSPLAEIAPGAILAPFVSLQARAKVGENVAVNTQAIVGHDVEVAADAVISSQVNLGGAVRIGSGCYVGMGALVKEGLEIGARTIISMGSAVYKDMPEDVIAVGNPARVSRRNEDRKVFKS